MATLAYAEVTTSRWRRRPGWRSTCLSGPSTSDDGFDDPDADLAPEPWAYGPTSPWERWHRALDRVPATAVERVCYLPDRPAGWAAVRDVADGQGVGLAWDLDVFPHLWLWSR